MIISQFCWFIEVMMSYFIVSVAHNKRVLNSNQIQISKTKMFMWFSHRLLDRGFTVCAVFARILGNFVVTCDVLGISWCFHETVRWLKKDQMKVSAHGTVGTRRVSCSKLKLVILNKTHISFNIYKISPLKQFVSPLWHFSWVHYDFWIECPSVVC